MGLKPFEAIDGEASPRRARFAANTTVFDCPICKGNGEEWSQFAVIVRGAVTDGVSVFMDYASERHLVCTRCLAKDRPGLLGKIGLVAVWTEGVGWRRLESI